MHTAVHMWRSENFVDSALLPTLRGGTQKSKAELQTYIDSFPRTPSLSI